MKTILTSIYIKIAVIIVFSLNVITSNGQLSSSVLANKTMKPTLHRVITNQHKVRFGFGLETYTSGNAHGGFYSAGVNMSKGKSVFSLGPSLHKRSLEINGIKFGYSYLLSGLNDRYEKDELEEMKNDPCDIMELRLLCYIQYIHKGRLSYKASRVETITGNQSNINYNSVRLSTVEVALCAEIDINIKWLKLRNYMGVTVFYHLNYFEEMYRARYSPALIFGTGFIIPNI